MLKNCKLVKQKSRRKIKIVEKIIYFPLLVLLLVDDFPEEAGILFLDLESLFSSIIFLDEVSCFRLSLAPSDFC